MVGQSRFTKSPLIGIPAILAFLFLSGRVAAQAFPDTIWLPVTFYDFHADGSNPEFNPNPHNGRLQTGMVADTLDKDRKLVMGSTVFFSRYIHKWFRPWERGDMTKPVYSDANGNQFTIQTVNHDTAFKNVVIPGTLPFRHIGNGQYQYQSDSFFGVDGKGFGNEPSGFDNNFSFTMELHTKFTYQPGMRFDFSGDDDVWAFVNGRLVLDLGGIHSTVSGSFTLDNIAGLVPGREYPFDFFYCERHTTHSTIKITTNMFTPPGFLRLYPDSVTNTPFGARDTVAAGERIDIYARVFDSTFARMPQYDNLVTWQLIDSLGNPVLTSTSGASTSFLPTEAYGTVTIVATFRDPANPLRPPSVVSVQLYVGPGKPHHVNLQSSPEIGNLRDDVKLDSIVIGEKETRAIVYAVVRDSMGNFVRFATNASWGSENSGIAAAGPDASKRWQGNIVKKGGGVTTVSASEPGLISDSVRVIVRAPTVGLVSAITRDSDGNGYLDRIEIRFDSTVTMPESLPGLKVRYGGTVFTVEKIQGAGGNMTGMDFVLVLKEQKTASLQTGWTPRLSIPAFSEAGTVTDFLSTDGAGPVVDRALLFPGSLVSAGGLTTAPDTLRVTFSEPVEWDASGSAPADIFNYFRLTQENREAFANLAPEVMTYDDGTVRIVMTNMFEVMARQDSLRLRGLISQVRDTSDNAPPANGRKAAVDYGGENRVTMAVGNNPFIPGQTPIPAAALVYYQNVLEGEKTGVVVSIASVKPLQPTKPGGEEYGSADIYDAVGNLVQKAKVGKVGAGNDYALFWNGRNRNGRIVGGGAYLVIVKVTDVDGMVKTERVKVGVQRYSK